MSISHFLPGGGCEYVATPIEKVYFVLEGEVTVKTEEGEIILKKYDSIYLAPDEARSILNHTNSPATHARRHPVPGAARVLRRVSGSALPGPDGDDARAGDRRTRDGRRRPAQPPVPARARAAAADALAAASVRPRAHARVTTTDHATSEEATCPDRSSPPPSPARWRPRPTTPACPGPWRRSPPTPRRATRPARRSSTSTCATTRAT